MYIETQVFNDLYPKIIEAFPGTMVGTIADPVEITFPYVNISVSDTYSTYQFVNSSRTEKYRDVDIDIDIYTNDVQGRKAKASQIMDVINREMLAMGIPSASKIPMELTNPVDNSTVFRLFARYRATVDENGIFYSRR